MAYIETAIIDNVNDCFRINKNTFSFYESVKSFKIYNFKDLVIN